MAKMTLNEFEQMLSDSVDATVREQDKAKALREELERCAAERQHWINVAAKMGNHEARALADQLDAWADASLARSEQMRVGPLFGSRESVDLSREDAA